MMMHVRNVRVVVLDPRVPMCMRVRLSWGIVGTVLVLVVRIMHVGMRVLHWFVYMVMVVLLGEVQPYTDRHQETCGDELDGHRLAEKHDGHESAEERRRREIGSCARCPEVAQR